MLRNPLIETDGFQRTFIDHLVEDNGYVEGDKRNFVPNYAMDTKILLEYLWCTQEDSMQHLRGIYNGEMETKVIERINNEIRRRGILDVLKMGVKDNGKTLYLMYRKPATTFNTVAVENYNKNILSVTKEVQYKEDGRVDLVIFLNGLAVISLELKSNTSGQNYRDAIRQYKKDRDPKSRLFEFKVGCIVNFAMDLEEVHMTTRLEGNSTTFLPYNRGNENRKGNPSIKDKMKVSYMWEDILKKDMLLYIIDKFVYLEVTKEKNEKGKTKISEKMIFPRYHQLDAVRQLVEDISVKKTKSNYLIQHSAGSGKTKTIAWLAHRLSSLYDKEEKIIFDTIIIITDRTVVDRQLQDAIETLEHKEGLIKVMDEKCSSADLADALNSNTKIIASTIQKFRFVLDKVKTLNDKTFAIIIDEAHSSTTGSYMEAVTTALTTHDTSDLKDSQDLIVDELSRNGKQDNVAMIAFTATPKATTLQMFGTKNEFGKLGAFHLYSMQQAIDEGFILDVLQNYITYKTYYEVNKTVSEDPRIKTSSGKRAIARYAELHDTNIIQKVEIIVEHFRENVMHKLGGKAKAMVVTSSREAAVRYSLAFEKYISNKGYKGIHSLVAFTGKIDIDDTEYTENGMNGFREEELAKRFASDAYQVLLVADKYQTGFDQPLLQAMYIDKKLKGVSAVQTLSRLNRKYPNKEDVFVLDFKNDYKDIREAFAPYYDTLMLKEEVDPNDIYILERRIDDSWVLNIDEINHFSTLLYKEKQSKKEIGIMTSYLTNTLERISKKEEQDKLDLRNTMNGFIRFYSFMKQVSTFEDVELHKKFRFIKYIVKAIDIQNDDDIDITDMIEITNIHQKKNDKKSEEKIDINKIINLPTPEGKAMEMDKLAHLSKVIEEINVSSGKDIDNTVGSTIVRQVYEDLVKSVDLEKSAKNNELKNFKHKFTESFTSILVDGLTKNKDFFMLLLQDTISREKVMDAIVDEVYKELRKK